MFSRFFIDRPIFANVIAIVTMLIGVVALFVLPIEQYPADHAADRPGHDHLSRRRRPGRRRHGRRPDRAAGQRRRGHALHVVDLRQRRLVQADGHLRGRHQPRHGPGAGAEPRGHRQPKLPEEVQRQGVTTRSSRPTIILVVALTSPDGPLRQPLPEQLRHAPDQGRAEPDQRRRRHQRLRRQRLRHAGLARPREARRRDLTTDDVLDAIREQNVQVAAGQIGQPPAPASQDFQFTVTTLGRLTTPSSSATSSSRRGAARRRAAARLTRVKDVARVELGGADLRPVVRRRRASRPPASPSSSSPGPTPSTWPRRSARRWTSSRSRSPRGWSTRSRSTPRSSSRSRSTRSTRRCSRPGVLVLIVILVFLQDWRAVLVPGDHGAGHDHRRVRRHGRAGFTVNMLTLFGLVLAIGIVVDDAIVIVENAAHHIDHDGLAPRTPRSRRWRGDRAGHRDHARADGRVPADRVPRRHHRPALPPVRPDDRRHGRHQRDQRRDAQAGAVRHLPAAGPERRRTRSTAAFNARLRPLSRRVYTGSSAGWSGRRVLMMLAVRRSSSALTGWWFTRLPTGFLPDRGPGLRDRRRPAPRRGLAGADARVVEQVEAILKETPGIENWVMIGGHLGPRPGRRLERRDRFIIWTPWEERTDPS